MGNPLLQTFKLLWDLWDIRVLVLSSLIIQFLLTFLAPFRKCCAKGCFLTFMWFLYLCADAVDLFTIGLISSSQSNRAKPVSGRNPELIVFWAPFLLLHLGGPDTITALSLEDNQLWHRHVLQLGTQVSITLYVILLSTNKHNGLLVPTLLIFIDGCIKYTERAIALYSASTEVIRDSPKETKGPNYSKMVDRYNSVVNADIPSTFVVKYSATEESMRRARVSDHENENDDSSRVHNNYDHQNWKMVKETDEYIEYAYFYYNKYRGLLADAFLSLKDDGEIREYFLYKRAEEAFKILEIELNLIYDVLHTKVFLGNWKKTCFRIVSFFMVVGSLVMFYFKDKRSYAIVDIYITFSLLVGAVVLDVSAFVMLFCSAWWVIIVSSNKVMKRIRKLRLGILRCSKWLRSSTSYSKRWSITMSQYNLLQFSITPPRGWWKLVVIKQIKDKVLNCFYVKSPTTDLRNVKFIIEEIQRKANLATEIEAFKDVCSARGNLVLQDDDYFLVSEYLLPWTIDIDYDESLLIWHLATDLCYWEASLEIRNDFHVKFCKALSDYMTYLLLRQPALLSEIVGKAEIRFEETSEDIRAILSEVSSSRTHIEEKKEAFTRHVLDKNSEIEKNLALMTKAKDSQSVLVEACRLSKQLNLFGQKKWEIMSKVWVEMVSYAAIHSSARSHLTFVSKGGELITFVWLFLVHLGFREPLQPSRGLRSTKLVICK